MKTPYRPVRAAMVNHRFHEEALVALYAARTPWWRRLFPWRR